MKHAACILAMVASAFLSGYPKAHTVPADGSATFVNALAKASPQMVRVPHNGTPMGSYPNCILQPMRPSLPTTSIIL